MRASERMRAKHEPKPIPLDKQVVCIRGFLSGKGRSYVEGMNYHRDDDAVKDIATRPYFAWPPRPLS